MKFSKPHRFASNAFSMLVAVLTSIGIWYVVSMGERREAQVDIVVDYYGIPSDLIITEGLVSKVVARLRGPETLLRTFTQQRLVRAVNLSNIRKGVTTVPLSSEILGQPLQAFELVDLQPSRIVVKADRLVERNVPLRYMLDSPLRGAALTVGDLTMKPPAVLLRGPERVITGISSLPVTVKLDPRSAGTPVEDQIILDTPSLVTAIPSSVRVEYTITSGRKRLSRSCKVNLIAENSRLYEVEPTEITVSVEVPEGLSDNTRYLNQLEASVVAPKLEPGQKARMAPRLRLPDGMTVVGPAPAEVTVTRKIEPKNEPRGEKPDDRGVTAPDAVENKE
ncbi:MAG: YbbR-like domain-containing protein [Desulfovibrio sp.]|jgi:hypothetical protein|nr:YbbR-like domain-containing protein [Desulfovibrio sp.]